MDTFKHWLETIEPSVLSKIKTMPISREKGKQEVAFVGKKRIVGSDKKVSLPLEPVSGTSVEDRYITHDHPVDTPTPFTALPSEEDLKAAIEAKKSGYEGMAIFSGPYFTVLKPTRDKMVASGYKAALDQAVQKSEINIAVNRLKLIGFDVGLGEK